MRLSLAAALAAALAGCGGTAGRGPEAGRMAAPQAAASRMGLRGPDDPTVHGARLFPATLADARAWGVEAGGGVRAVVAGLRVLSSAAGDVAAAAVPLPANPTSVVELPERLGGGFVMALGAHLWRSATWLGPAAPVFTLSAPIAEVIVGLDRVYVRAAQGPLVGIDPRTGSSLDLGPLPPSPRVLSVAALDAWRAIAVADLRGVLVTLDAGSSWRPVQLPIEPTRAIALPDAFAVGGFDGARSMQWWEVLPDGQASRLASSPPSGSVVERDRVVPSLGPAPLGVRPLRAAIEDGWPLTDGTALVARDGSLIRVRLADGAAVETVSDAFSLKPARCHPLSLARTDDRGAFGFVCGEPRGRTAVFRWDAAASRLVELRRFDTPREVLASANGALAVRGPCAAQAADRGAESGDKSRAFCVMAPGGSWSEIHFSGVGANRARLVVLSNGRIALLRPPEAGDLSTARLTLTDGARATHVALRVQPAPPDAMRALRSGVWMDGFEERRPGVLGGWIDAAGSILGVEVALDGEVHVGEYIRDAGAPVASGRWAFGWTASRGGFETIDGGMSWTKEISLPEPIAEPRVGRDRSCGPVGCVIAGWLRLGWGTVEAAPSPEPPPARPRVLRRSPALTMECEPVGARPQPEGASAAPRPGIARPFASPQVPFRGFTTGASSGAVTEFRPFAGRAAPAIPTGDLGLSSDASHLLERGPRSRPLGRVYTWGPSAGDWGPSGRWQVIWGWPWQSSSGVAGSDGRASGVSLAPWPSLEVAERMLGHAVGLPPEWTVVPGDDPDHALLVGRRSTLGGMAGAGGLLMLETLEADHAPVEVRRGAGEPLPDLQGAVRIGGRWYVATAQGSGEPAATVVWLLDGSVAREIGRVPRVASELSGPVRLARRAAGAGAGAATMGLVVTGPDSDRAEHGPSLWVSSFDPETHIFDDPELLAPVDLSDRPVRPCSGDDPGWEVEAAFPGTVDVGIGSAWSARLRGVLARLRLSRAGACVDQVFGSVDAQGARAEDAIWSASRGPLRVAGGAPAASGGGGVRTLGATVVTDRIRARLRCRVLSP